MNIAFLAPANSIHTVRWANALSERGCHITVITMHEPEKNSFHSEIRIEMLPFKAPFGYYLNGFAARKLIKRLKPDLLHSHYATGYGTLSRFVQFHPTLLSVWGSDVFEFPYQSDSKRKILIKNLKAADFIASTSLAMKQQTEKFHKPAEEIAITPFGIDLTVFRPEKDSNKDEDSLTIGMIKTMEKHYGPQYLLEAISILLKKLADENSSFVNKINVLMVGRGSQIGELESLASNLGIRDAVTFTGEIAHAMVPEYLNKLDIYCAPSEMESFGVAVIEASACEIPVIVSNVGGLPEVVIDNETGYIVKPKSPEEIAEKLYVLVNDPELRKNLGESGRRFVKTNYDWENNVSTMMDIYKEIAL